MPIVDQSGGAKIVLGSKCSLCLQTRGDTVAERLARLREYGADRAEVCCWAWA
jgi:hypothetical protein